MTGQTGFQRLIATPHQFPDRHRVLTHHGSSVLVTRDRAEYAR
jgi:hypothetical protein